ncbi:hypothetical protein CGLAU_04735 [Corynebacterium glaucum]|uniref:DUF1707 domain-containing protein n=2 Tax=Corynebacterium glaucum TaxID=187491 RepID=A0A1Q2HVP2_9CORY|nr:hypothetical protein CGLAU_04735 [Corynebacterium glaucum]
MQKCHPFRWGKVKRKFDMLAIMQDNPEIRVGHADRSAALERLGTHFADGYLDLGEFEDRTARAASARTRGELDSLFDDLPDAPSETANAPVLRAEDGVDIREVEVDVQQKLARKKRVDMMIGGLWGVTVGVFLMLGVVFDVEFAWIVFPIAGVLNVILANAYGMSGDEIRALNDLEHEQGQQRAERMRIVIERRRELGEL